MVDLRVLLEKARQQRASDVHLKPGRPPFFRVEGELGPLPDHPPLRSEDTLELTRRLLNSRQREILSRKLELDLSFGMEGLGRFRLAVFQQRNSLSLVIRLIPAVVPSVEELNLPPVLKEISTAPRGLILVTGNTGSGKSTTLAAMIRHLNETSRNHIITIEDPIEFLFEDRLSLISQREVDHDTESFPAALRAALRQDPDVILVGEMRDLETIQTAMQAAETGHLVLSTLHTGDATETVHRIISMFPAPQQHDIRFRFAAVLRAVISMRLIRSSLSGRRVPAVEILRNTELITSLITQPERTREIRKALEAGAAQYGMQTFDQSILMQYEQGHISRDDALRYATAPEDVKLRLQGVVSSSESI